VKTKSNYLLNKLNILEKPLY